MRTRPPELYGIPIKEIARLCEVSLKTATRWKHGQCVPPKSALMILRGDLRCFDPTWSGWVLQHGYLVSPEGWQASRGDVLSIQLVQAQLAAYKHENTNLRTEIADLGAEREALEDQPLPGALSLK